MRAVVGVRARDGSAVYEFAATGQRDHAEQDPPARDAEVWAEYHGLGYVPRLPPVVRMLSVWHAWLCRHYGPGLSVTHAGRIHCPLLKYRADPPVQPPSVRRGPVEISLRAISSKHLRGWGVADGKPVPIVPVLKP